MCSRRQLPGMKHSSSRDAGSMALRRSVSFPRGTRVTYVTRDVPLREHRAVSRRYGERDVHAAILANPCLVCGMHSYGKGIDKPGVARREPGRRTWKVRDVDHTPASQMSCTGTPARRPWRPPYLKLSEP